MAGSLVQRGGAWSVVYRERDAAGKLRQRWISLGRCDKATAETKFHEVMARVGKKRMPTAPADLTLAKYLAEWLDAVRPTLAPTTAERYAGLVTDLGDVAGALKLRSLTRADVIGIIAALRQRGRRKGTRRLSETSLRKALATLRSALSAAVEAGHLPDNPAAGLKKFAPKAATKPVEAPDAATVAKLLAAIAGTPLEVPVALAAGTGARRGEVLAARWRDLDPEAGTLAICRSLEQTTAGLAFKSPKDGEARVVPLPAFLRDRLARHRAEQKKAAFAAGRPWREDGLIVAAPEGGPIPPTHFSVGFARAVKRAGLPHFKLHALRHFFATTLLNQGVDLATVSKLLGHANVLVTASVYAGVGATLKAEAVGKLDAVLATVATPKAGA